MPISIFTGSFGLAALVSAGCLLLVAVRGWGSRGQPQLLAALFISSVWAAALMADAGRSDIPSWWLASIEALRYAAWLFALRAAAGFALGTWLRHWSLGICIAILGYAIALPLLGGLLGQRLDLALLIGRSGLLFACLGLILIEQLLRNAPPATRRGVNLCALGVGGQFAYDLFIYSQAELLGAVDITAWAVRGFAVSLLLPIAAVGFLRVARDEPALFVSRQVVFYTTAFLAVGGYLLVMSLGGYYVRVHGGSWGESLQLLFFVGAGLVLATVLLSDTLWRRLRVFIAKHFFRNKYDYRVEWLRFVRTLSSTEEGDPRQTAIRAVAQILRSPGGMLFLRSEKPDGFEPVAQWSETGAILAAPPAQAAATELVVFLKERHWVIDLQEYRATPSVYRNISLPEWLFDARLSWRIVAPLLELNRLVGFLVLRAPPPPFHMNFEDRDLLQMAGRHIAVLLAQQLADQRLAESQQFDAFNRFAAFVMHDLKNSVAQLQLLVNNAVRHRNNPEFMDDAISTITNTVGRMTRLIEQLQTRDTTSQSREVDVARIIRDVAARGGHTPGIDVGSPGDAPVWVRADPDRLAAVLDHVTRNAQDAAGPGGRVAAGLQRQDGTVLITVSDNGPGMDPQFVKERLFRPFDSTKGSKGMGIGAYQTREYVRQLGGEVEVQSTPGSGTTFLITLPLCLKKNAES